MIYEVCNNGSTILSRNEDVHPMVDAAARYGHNGIGMRNNDWQYTLLVTADVHGDYYRFRSAIDYMNGIDAINAGICLGDMAPSNFADPHEWFAETVKYANKPWYTVIGNHDGGNSNKGEISATVSEQYDRWIKPTLNKIGDESIKTTYYAVKDEKHKVEIIILHCHDLPDDKDDNGDFCVHRGTIGYSQAQIDWFTSELKSIPEGYTLLVAMHTITDEITLEAGVWTEPNVGDPKSDDNCYIGLITDTIDAWMNGTAVKATYKNDSKHRTYDRYLPAINVDVDFSDRGTGIFAGYLTGHVHVDSVGHVTQYPKQKYYSFETTANDHWQAHGSDLPRTVGTKEEDCITVVVVDTITRQLRLVRVGSNFTMNMTRREFYVGTY